MMKQKEFFLFDLCVLCGYSFLKLSAFICDSFQGMREHPRVERRSCRPFEHAELDQRIASGFNGTWRAWRFGYFRRYFVSLGVLAVQSPCRYFVPLGVPSTGSGQALAVQYLFPSCPSWFRNFSPYQRQAGTAPPSSRFPETPPAVP